MLKHALSDLELCWLHGFKAFHEETDELSNPYPKGTKYAHYWQEGWWEGFYNTDNLSESYQECYAVESTANIEQIAC